jgi:cupin 2 domain-containing protein
MAWNQITSFSDNIFMDEKPANLFKNIPVKFDNELTDVLFDRKNIRVERIVSMGQASPPGFWYDQDQGEFVILLKGSAGLLVEGNDQISAMHSGDYLIIPPHVKHRVEWTDPSEQTVWLAVFYGDKT